MDGGDAAAGSARAFAAATVLKDLIYVIGGTDGRTELAEPRWPTIRWPGWARRRGPLRRRSAQPRAGLAAVAVGTQVFALGGAERGGEKRSTSSTTRELGAWSRLGTPMAGEWRNLGAAPLNNKIYVVGGWSGGYLDAHEQYRR